jgi:hypothetical protein
VGRWLEGETVEVAARGDGLIEISHRGVRSLPMSVAILWRPSRRCGADSPKPGRSDRRRWAGR